MGYNYDNEKDTLNLINVEKSHHDDICNANESERFLKKKDKLPMKKLKQKRIVAQK